MTRSDRDRREIAHTWRHVAMAVLFGLVCAMTGEQAMGQQRAARRKAAEETGMTMAKKQVPAPKKAAAPKPTLYVTSTAHLDTQWLWTIQDTINKYIPATLRENFALFDEFPDYVFSFEGAFRYMLAKEYYPEDYARLKKYVKQGRWHVCGSSVDACDVNIPSPESLIRQILYGNNYFERELGERSSDIFLPDCFGFGYALPSIAAHCGLKGFSTQKLTWGSSVGIPFDIGVWEGVDGSEVVAALNPGAYDTTIREDLSHSKDWLERIRKLGDATGLYAGYMYFGVGDRGGAPDAESVKWLEKSIEGDGPVRVISAPADQLFKDITPEQRAKLPRYKGELLMTRHGTGCYTSQAAMKRWNRQNEQLAAAAERASVIADWLGGAAYPREKLDRAWVRFLWHQFHDDLTGTSIPQAYQFSWNDEIVSLNEFAAVLENAVGAAARSLDTAAEGTPVVVFNPLERRRQDVVTARVQFPGQEPGQVRVFDPDGTEVPSQVQSIYQDEVSVLFVADVPAVGYAVYDVRPAAEGCTLKTGLSAGDSAIENKFYRVILNEQGDVASIHDKRLDKELLSAPMRLELLRDKSDHWPEWEIMYEDITAEPYAYVGGPAKVKVLEKGPARATIEVTREAQGSTFVQRIRLAAGDAGDRVDFDTVIEWRTPATLLKAEFPTASSNPKATYDLGFGVIDRPNNTEAKYEVPAQQWADVTNADGSFGVTVMDDCKYGWDKPSDSMLRLTLIHSPNDVIKDMGWHRLTYSVAGHNGDWRDGNAVDRAARLNQPLRPFQTSAHAGRLGKRFSLLSVDDPSVVVRAIKKAERSDEVIVRLQEAHGRAAKNIAVKCAAGVESVQETNGVEREGRHLDASGSQMRLDFDAFQPRTLALKLVAPEVKLHEPTGIPVSLSFDRDVISEDSARSDGDFDGQGHSIPAELLPEHLTIDGVQFWMGPKEKGQPNAVVCAGQTVRLPKGDFDHVYMIAAAMGGARLGTFYANGEPIAVRVGGFTGWLGQAAGVAEGAVLLGKDQTVPAYIHRDELAWIGTHRHNSRADRSVSRDENEAYIFCNLYKCGFALPPGADRVTLPRDRRIRILALTAAKDPNAETRAADWLYDETVGVFTDTASGIFMEPGELQMAASAPDTEIVYTLDGSLPDKSSKPYDGPVPVTDTMTVTARGVHRGELEDFATRVKLTKVKPTPGKELADQSPGLEYACYEGEWEKLPDFDKLTPVKRGVDQYLDTSQCGRDERFAIRWRGFIEIPTTGVYWFWLGSDDGSRLTIDNVTTVDNDGLHGFRARGTQAALEAGLHPITVEYFNRTGDSGLKILCDGPAMSGENIWSMKLYHEAGQK